MVIYLCELLGWFVLVSLTIISVITLIGPLLKDGDDK
jgi:hypothetical protein